MVDLIESIARVGGVALVFLAFGLGFGEGALLADLFVPGEVGMVIVGAAAAHGDVSVVFIVLAGAAGAFAGDSFGYFLGRRFGPGLIERWPRLRRRIEPEYERAQQYFERRGGVAVFVARWVGALRAIVPVVAGTAGMPYRRFAAWDVPAALLWTTVIVGAGYHFGDDVAEAVDRIGLGVSLAVCGAVILALYLLRRRTRARHAQHTAG